MVEPRLATCAPRDRAASQLLQVSEMKISTVLLAVLAATTLAAASHATAAPAPERDYVVRAVPASPNGKDVFKRLVKVPKEPRTQAHAATCECPMPGRASAASAGMPQAGR